MRWLTTLAGAAVMAALIVYAGPSVVLGMLRDVGWALLPIAALYAIHVGLRALALWRGLPDRMLPFSDVLRVRLAGEAVEVFTFTGPWLAEPAKGWLLIRHGLTTAQAFGFIALEYLLYTLAAAWMAAAALGVLLHRHAMPRAMSAPTLGVELVIGLITVGFLYAVVAGRGSTGLTLALARRIRHFLVALSGLALIWAMSGLVGDGRAAG